LKPGNEVSLEQVVDGADDSHDSVLSIFLITQVSGYVVRNHECEKSHVLVFVDLGYDQIVLWCLKCRGFVLVSEVADGMGAVGIDLAQGSNLRCSSISWN
jgi:hypothetical protein